MHLSVTHCVWRCLLSRVFLSKALREARQATLQELSSAETTQRAHRELFLFWGLTQTGEHKHHGKTNRYVAFASPAGRLREGGIQFRDTDRPPDFNKGSIAPNRGDKGKARRGKVAEWKSTLITVPPSSNHWMILDCVINSADKNCYQMSLFIYSI